jgi:predicted DNA-binding transcriptional regulator AlpA
VDYPASAQKDDGVCKRRSKTYCPADPLLTAAEAEAERGQALSTFWREVKAGRLPPAIRITPRSPRWRRSEILAGLEALREGQAGS